MSHEKRQSEIFRTRFLNEIVAEVLLPEREKGRMLILCSGVPSLPQKDRVLRFLAKKGYGVIFPRYRGTWESGGKFLERSPHEDILNIIHEILKNKKVFDIRKGEWKTFKLKEIFLLGVSFGGPAVLLASSHPKVKKVVALSPVVDWRCAGVDESFESFQQYTEQAFGGAYRASEVDWEKLRKGNFYNPLSQPQKIVGKKILLFHALDDTIVPYEPSLKLSKLVDARLITKKTGGHFSTRTLSYKRNWEIIENFFQS